MSAPGPYHTPGPAETTFHHAARWAFTAALWSLPTLQPRGPGSQGPGHPLPGPRLNARPGNMPLPGSRWPVMGSSPRAIGQGRALLAVNLVPLSAPTGAPRSWLMVPCRGRSHGAGALRPARECDDGVFLNARTTQECLSVLSPSSGDTA